MRTFRTKVLFPVLGLAAGTLAALVLVEGVAKIVDVRQLHRKHHLVSRITRTSEIPGVRYEMVPGISTVTPGYDTVVSINGHGFRGKETTLEKAPGTYRIAVVGDSISFGRYLGDEDIFPALLEKRMNSSGRHAERVEVINASLSGRDTWEELALLEHKVLPMSPDLVVLEICLNDHIRLHYPEDGGSLSGAGLFGELAWWQYSSFLKFLDGRVQGFREYHVKVVRRIGLYQPAGNEVTRNYFINPRDMIRLEDHWEEWSRALLRIRDLAKESGAEVMFVVFPIKYHIKYGYLETAPELTRLAAENDIPFLDLAPTYAKEGITVYMDNLHPMRRGHRLAAKKIQDVIEDRFLRPEVTTGTGFGKQ